MSNARTYRQATCCAIVFAAGLAGCVPKLEYDNVFDLEGAGFLVGLDPNRYTVSVTVKGLTSGTLGIDHNGASFERLTITADGTHSFGTTLNSESAYSLSFSSQPSAGFPRCRFATSASGFVRGNVVVSVECHSEVYFHQASNLLWMRCVIGQAWSSASADCSGNGGGTPFGASPRRFCNGPTNDCNGGTNSGILGTFQNGAFSTAWSACDTLEHAGRSDWRVPTLAESVPIPNINPTIFFNLAGDHWTANSVDTGNATVARFTTATSGQFAKDMNNPYVRCVAPGDFQ